MSARARDLTHATCPVLRLPAPRQALPHSRRRGRDPCRSMPARLQHLCLSRHGARRRRRREFEAHVLCHPKDSHVRLRRRRICYLQARKLGANQRRASPYQAYHQRASSSLPTPSQNLPHALLSPRSLSSASLLWGSWDRRTPSSAACNRPWGKRSVPNYVLRL